jgi:hypothetical protein
MRTSPPCGIRCKATIKTVGYSGFLVGTWGRIPFPSPRLISDRSSSSRVRFAAPERALDGSGPI